MNLMLFVPIICVAGKLYLIGCGVVFGKKLRLIGLPRVRKRKNSIIELGENVTFHSNSTLNSIGVNHKVILRTQAEGAILKIGNRVGISGGAICAREKVIIGNDVLLGSNVVVSDNDFHPLEYIARLNNKDDITSEPVHIGDGVWVGADAYICKGVTIGHGSVIGAKSVVTKSIPANCVAAGAPAVVIKNIKSI